jgi:hypothetical protein
VGIYLEPVFITSGSMTVQTYNMIIICIVPFTDFVIFKPKQIEGALDILLVKLGSDHNQRLTVFQPS